MERFASLVMRHRAIVILIWVGIAVAGGYAAGKLNDRWSQQFTLPGRASYEADKRAFEAFGSGRQYPYIAVFQTKDDVRQHTELRGLIDDIHTAMKGSRVSSFFDGASDQYVSADGHTMYAYVYPGGEPAFGPDVNLPTAQKLIATKTPAGVKGSLTGYIPIYMSQSSNDEGPSIWVDLAIGALGALLVLLLIFGTVPAVLMPLITAMASILGTFLAVWAVTYVTDVSIIVQFLIALVGLGIAIDYSLLMIFRFREELALGTEVPDALRTTAKYAGHAIIISGTTVAIGLLSMIILPVPFIRAIGIGGMLIPLVSVIATLTLQLALLSLLGTRINRWRIPLLWRMANISGGDGRFWKRWTGIVTRRPLPVFLVGALLVGLIVAPVFHLQPRDSELRFQPAAGSAQQGRAALAKAGFGQGLYEPMQVVVEGGATKAEVDRLVAAFRKVKNVEGVAAPGGQWKASKIELIELVGKPDSHLPATTSLIDDLRASVKDVGLSKGVKVTVAGGPAEDRDFIHAIYGNFKYVLLFVIVLTYLLLARALRSLVLPLKAVILNLLSLGAALGAIVWVFQDGHGSQAIWGYHATESIVPWIPLMIFAFLFGISMDYEVFMLSRIREAYDDTHDTSQAVGIGLMRTGKLVTSAAAILMFTFLVMSNQPGPDFKEFAIGLAAGIIIDATLIRGLLVPSIICLLGSINWIMPAWAKRLLFVRERPHAVAPAPAVEQPPLTPVG